tara:strand:+ start:459 stop:1169 length:711 start_codon:yes stop_codon:yes gene_type:complete
MSFERIRYDAECLENYYNKTVDLRNRLVENFQNDNNTQWNNKQRLGCKLPNNRNLSGLGGNGLLSETLVDNESKLLGIQDDLGKRKLGSTCSYQKDNIQSAVPYIMNNDYNTVEMSTDNCKLSPRHEKLTNPASNLRGIENGFSNYDFLCEDPQRTFWIADSQLKCATNKLTQLEAKGVYTCDLKGGVQESSQYLDFQNKLEKNNDCCIINGQAHTLPNGNSWGETDCSLPTTTSA